MKQSTITEQNIHQSDLRAGKPDLTTSDIEEIQKTLEDLKKSIAEGKAIEALKQINQIDDKLLDAMSKSPPPMLDKSSGNDNE